MKPVPPLFLIIFCCSITVLLVVTLAEDQNHDSHLKLTTVFETKSGPVVGTTSQTVDGKEVNVFYGIPYAEPPVGELRFKPPKEIEPWTSVLQAVKPLSTCYQTLPSGSYLDRIRSHLRRPWSEDCLHLNIWSQSPKPEKLPVVFFIHGGGFKLGSGLLHTDGTTMASEGTVIVTFNHRLGVFGFFNLGTAGTPGNAALMDQLLALQWVKENIDVFGGDPEAITLMGLSAGSASVGYHLLAPKSSGLFKKAIMMSGAPTNHWAIVEPEKNIEISRKLLNTLGCQSPDDAVSLQCIQNRHPEDVLEASNEGLLFNKGFLPTVDGEFITEHPSVSVESGRFNPADVIVGTSQDEGTELMLTMNPGSFRTMDGRLFRRDFSKVIRGSMPDMSDLQCKTVDVAYTNWANSDDPLMLRDAAKDIYGDSLFNCDINHFADMLSQTEASVYRYVYSHKTAAALMFSPSWSGAGHAQDHLPLLGSSKFITLFPQSSIEVSVATRFRKHIMNFIYKGDPNIKDSGYPEEPEWPRYDGNRNYLHFAKNSSILSNYRQRECSTWLKLIPMLQKKC